MFSLSKESTACNIVSGCVTTAVGSDRLITWSIRFVLGLLVHLAMMSLLNIMAKRYLPPKAPYLIPPSPAVSFTRSVKLSSSKCFKLNYCFLFDQDVLTRVVVDSYKIFLSRT